MDLEAADRTFFDDAVAPVSVFRARPLPTPAHPVDFLLRFLRQNHGALSDRARAREFAALHPQEAERIEEIYAELFLARAGSP